MARMAEEAPSFIITSQDPEVAGISNIEQAIAEYEVSPLNGAGADMCANRADIAIKDSKCHRVPLDRWG